MTSGAAIFFLAFSFACLFYLCATGCALFQQKDIILQAVIFVFLIYLVLCRFFLFVSFITAFFKT